MEQSHTTRDLRGLAWRASFALLAVEAALLFLLVSLYRESNDRNRYVLVVAGLGWYVAAVAMGFVEGSSDGMALLTQLFGAGDRTVTHFTRSIEEFLEMFGTTLLLMAFLGQLASVTTGCGFVFKSNGRHRAAAGAQRGGIVQSTMQVQRSGHSESVAHTVSIGQPPLQAGWAASAHGGGIVSGATDRVAPQPALMASNKNVTVTKSTVAVRTDRVTAALPPSV